MGRMAALEENGFEKDTKEYLSWENKMIEFESVLHSLRYERMTPSKYRKLCRYFRLFENGNLKFTVGSADYRDVHRLLEASFSVFDLEFISTLIIYYINTGEINPIYYGYAKDDIKSFVSTVESIRSKYFK